MTDSGKNKDSKNLIEARNKQHLLIKDININYNNVLKIMTNYSFIIPLFFFPIQKLEKFLDNKYITRLINESIINFIEKADDNINKIIFQNQSKVNIQMKDINSFDKIILHNLKKLDKKLKNKNKKLDNLEIDKYYDYLNENLDDSFGNDKNNLQFYLNIKEMKHDTNKSLLNYELWCEEENLTNNDINDIFNNLTINLFCDDDDVSDFFTKDELCINRNNINEDYHNRKCNEKKLFDIFIKIYKISKSKTLLIDISENKNQCFKTIIENYGINLFNRNFDFKINFNFLERIFKFNNEISIKTNMESILMYSNRFKIFDFIQNFENVCKLYYDTQNITLKKDVNDSNSYIIKFNNIEKFRMKVIKYYIPVENDLTCPKESVIIYHLSNLDNPELNHEVKYEIQTINKECCFIKLSFTFDSPIKKFIMLDFANQQKENLIKIQGCLN